MFQENEFPYVSIIEGGFRECHDILTSINQEMLNHLQKKCKLCKAKIKIKKDQSTSFFDFVANVFNMSDNNNNNSSSTTDDVAGPDKKANNSKQPPLHPNSQA